MRRRQVIGDQIERFRLGAGDEYRLGGAVGTLELQRPPALNQQVPRRR